MHFLGKKEHRYVQPDCGGFAIHTKHPVLVNHQHPWHAIYVGSRPAHPSNFLEKTALCLAEAMGPWRSSSEFLNKAADPLKILETGLGLLVRVPAPLVDPICRLFKKEEMSFSNLPEHTPRQAVKVLIASLNFVVAEDFRVEET